MELIDRYIYAVTRNLPESQRKEVELELRGLIRDMLDEHIEEPDQEATPSQVEAVLQQLGNPAKLADNYRGFRRYLIGPGLFDPYIQVLKIVGLVIFIVNTVAFAAKQLAEPVEVHEIILSYMGALANAAIYSFGIVTLIFALISYYMPEQPDRQGEKEKPWKPSELPPVPAAKLRISPLDPLLGIVFTVAFAIGFIYAAERVPYVDSNALNQYVPWILVLAGLGVVVEIVKLVTRVWNVTLVLADLGLSVLSLVVLYFVLNDTSVWKPEYETEWFTSTAIYIIGAIIVVDMISNGVTGIRAWREKNAARA